MAEAMIELRNNALTTAPADIGIVPTNNHPHVWGILMEIGYPEGSVTLLALADGSTSLYFSGGGGMIGGGEHTSVNRQAVNFVSAAEEFLDQFTKTDEYPLPEAGRVRFYLRTFLGNLTAEAGESMLGEGRHKLSKLFYAGQDVITALREIKESGPRP